MRPLKELFPAEDYPSLLVGLNAPDDAAVWLMENEQAIVVTTDFFTPVVDDPFDYGQIAAANALSDLYAMGAKPILALNIAAFPPDLPVDILCEIIRGGAEKVRQAGAVVAGGHTIQDKEPKYGLVALGLASRDRLMTKANAKPGELLVLTKPLGTGVITTALRAGQAADEDVRQAIAWMASLNDGAADLAGQFDVQAATDVTGYSLLGHGLEMAEASGVKLRIHLPSVPFFEKVYPYARRGFFSGGSANNRLYYGPRVHFATSIEEYAEMLLFDAQTSGGLLFTLNPVKWEGFSEKAAHRGLYAWPIGEVEVGAGIEVVNERFNFDGTPITKSTPIWFFSASSDMAENLR